MPSLERDGLRIEDYEAYLFNNQSFGELITSTGEPNKHRKQLIELKAIKPCYIKDRKAHDKLLAPGWEMIKRATKFFGHK